MARSTLDEIKNRLRETGELSAIQEAAEIRERERLQRVEKLKEEAAPLGSALRSLGVEVAYPWELIGRKHLSHEVVTTLFESLETGCSIELGEIILRALAVPEAISLRPKIIKIFELAACSGGAFADAAALAIAGTTTADNIHETIELLGQGKYGHARIGLLVGLKRVKPSRRIEILRSLRGDEGLAGAIRKLYPDAV